MSYCRCTPAEQLLVDSFKQRKWELDLLLQRSGLLLKPMLLSHVAGRSSLTAMTTGARTMASVFDPFACSLRPLRQQLVLLLLQMPRCLWPSPLAYQVDQLLRVTSTPPMVEHRSERVPQVLRRHRL